MRSKQLIENSSVRPPTEKELTDPRQAYVYAACVLEGPFPAGEPAIATSAARSYDYAEKILKRPFPAGEPAIAKSAPWALSYACYVLKGVFPLAHETLLRDPRVNDAYRTLCKQDPKGMEYMKNVYMDYGFED